PVRRDEIILGISRYGIRHRQKSVCHRLDIDTARRLESAQILRRLRTTLKNKCVGLAIFQRARGGNAVALNRRKRANYRQVRSNLNLKGNASNLERISGIVIGNAATVAP